MYIYSKRRKKGKGKEEKKIIIPTQGS